jgi:hypothetical protein
MLASIPRLQSALNFFMNEEILHTVKQERNILHAITRKKANCIGHMLNRNCLLKHVIEGKMDRRTGVTRRRGRTRKQLLDDLTERIESWELKEEALDRTLWGTRSGRDCSSFVRQPGV